MAAALLTFGISVTEFLMAIAKSKSDMEFLTKTNILLYPQCSSFRGAIFIFPHHAVYIQSHLSEVSQVLPIKQFQCWSH